MEVITTRGMWAGVLENIKTLNFDDTFAIQTGDVIFLYTDGVTEAVKKKVPGDDQNKFELYGEERLAEVLAAAGEKPVDDIKNYVLESLAEFDCRDDVTMLILKKTK